MRKSIFLIIFLVFSCHEASDDMELAPFSSDGCSLFPDHSVMTQQDWCDCCFQHDMAYWQGGTKQQREHADVELRQCVLQKTGNETLAKLMYEGVRVGGSPYFYNWYRWGYGWPYERKYQALSEKELEQVKILIKQYHTNNHKNYCESH